MLRIAPTYRPNHDDGVQITATPLWPLFRHKPWQKTLKETWAKLENGRLQLGAPRHGLLARPRQRGVQDRQIARHRPRPEAFVYRTATKARESPRPQESHSGMSIAAFIRDQIFSPRLNKAAVLAVYDPDRRYRDICQAMADKITAVVDASDSSIEAREAAMAAFASLGKPNGRSALLGLCPRQTAFVRSGSCDRPVLGLRRLRRGLPRR